MQNYDYHMKNNGLSSPIIEAVSGKILLPGHFPQ